MKAKSILLCLMALSSITFAQSQVITLEVSAGDVTANNQRVIQYGTDTTGVKFKLLENIALIIITSDTVFDIIEPGTWTPYSEELHLSDLPVGDTLEVIFKIDTVGFWSTYEAKWFFTKRSISSLSINETAISNYNVYPNPANTHIYIDNGNYQSLNGYAIKIVNSVGQEVFTQSVNQKLFYIDISTWTGGMYFLHILDGQGNTIEVKKIVLQ